MKELCSEIHYNMQLSCSTVFKPGIYDFGGQSGAVVKSSNILLDFTGVVFRGGIQPGQSMQSSEEIHKEFSYSDDRDEAERVLALGYRGIALTLRGVSNVTVRGLTASGFELAILVDGCENITIEQCNLSDNFHDVECGWNEHGPRGGILLLNSNRCTICSNRANNVWNALCLKRSNDTLVKGNDFSYCSNMCIKMWHACHNVIVDNNLSWGLRIKPGEVHARDSAGLLLDSGCDYNLVRHNDITHGGDGIFIRVLNGWQSRFNIFEDNDCSYANNNAIEAWSNNNVWLRNKANYSSYGFWMGGSDNTLMQENEAAYNGCYFKNAPEKFGNAGVAIANGSGTNFRMIGNHIHDNCGPGVAICFKDTDPVHHMLIEDNHIHHNRNLQSYAGHGIYLKNASFISISNNDFHDNEGEAIAVDSGVTNLVQLSAGTATVKATAVFPQDFATVGDSLLFGCQTDVPATIRWDFGDGSFGSGTAVKKSFAHGGSYYVGVIASTESRSDLAGSVLHVVPQGKLVNQEYSFESTHGNRRTLRMELPSTICLEDANRLSFFLKQYCEADTDWDKTVQSPIVTLMQDDDNKLVLTPLVLTSDYLFTAKTWEKVLYRYYCLPLTESNEDWKVERFGTVTAIRTVSVEIIHKNAGCCVGSLKGLVFHKEKED